jgi:hypothetical protein
VTTVAEHALFDGDDVDVGEAAPDAEEMDPDEVAEMQAAIADPNSPKSGVEAS